jgi:hypothetical protein
VLLILTGGIGSILQAQDISFKAGLGYEFFSQEFFLDSLAHPGVDTLSTLTSLKTTYLDAVKGLIAISYFPTSDRRTGFRGKYEQTREFIRVKLTGDLAPRRGRAKFDFSGELDWRKGYADSVDPGDNYIYGYGRAKFMLPVSGATTLWGQLRSDFVQFDATSSLSFNHYHIGGKAGITTIPAGFSSVDLNVFYLTRQVPDSTAMEYQSYGVDASYLGFYTQGNVDLLARVEKREYNRLDNSDDYLRLEFDGRNRLGLGKKAFIRPEVAFERVYFTESQLFSSNYNRFGIDLLLGVEGSSKSAGLGPHFEILRQQQFDSTLVEDYTEKGLKAALDYLKAGLIFASLESTVGFRNLSDEGDLHSDFAFERANLLADWRLTGALTLNILLSAEWEWHDQQEENSQVFLVSSSLYYRF